MNSADAMHARLDHLLSEGERDARLGSAKRKEPALGGALVSQARSGGHVTLPDYSINPQYIIMGEVSDELLIELS